MQANHQHPFRAGGTLLAVCLASAILPLNFTGGVLAIPALAHEMGGSPQAFHWVSNAFLLTFGSLLMAMGSLADNHGRKRLFIYGVVAFSLASLMISVASTMLMLNLCRAAQGIAGAAMLAGGAAALADTFSGPSRLRAFSLQGTSFGIGLSCGPIVAGYLVEHGGWRSLFLVSLACGGLAALAGVRWMRESRASQPNPTDVPGIMLFSIALALLTWGILQAAISGWRSPQVGLLLAGSLASGLAFIRVERHSRHPMLDLSLFRYLRFLGVQLLPVATCYCFVVLLVLLPARFMGGEGLDSMTTGVLMLALSGPMLVVPGVAAWLTRWASPATLCCIGLVIAATGLFSLSISSERSAVVLSMLVIGAGTGLPWGLMDALSVSVVPQDRAGMATGIFSTVRVAGEGIALAMVSTLLMSLIDLHRVDDASSALPRSAMQYLASGNTPALNDATLTALRALYLHAFNTLMVILALITLLSALLIHLCLHRQPATREASL